jgi:uncharacterized protein (TIGR00730 family)
MTRDGDELNDAMRERLVSALTASPTYRLSEDDTEFLDQDTARPARLLLEMMRPEFYLQRHGINSTVVVFGSARLVAPAQAARELRAAEAAVAASPGDAAQQSALREARLHVRYSVYYDEARSLARSLACICRTGECRDFVVVTGGGPGIMEAANRGAWEAGELSLGFNIDLPREQRPNPYISPDLAFRFHYFAMRKMHFLLRARALVAFPGGYGTFDELFEALTLVQTRKIAPIPIVLVGREYWQRAVDFGFLVDEGFIDARDVALFQTVETGAEAADLIRRHYS